MAERIMGQPKMFHVTLVVHAQHAEDVTDELIVDGLENWLDEFATENGFLPVLVRVREVPGNVTRIEEPTEDHG